MVAPAEVLVEKNSFLILNTKAILWLDDRVCETSTDLLSSENFRKFYNRCITDLVQRNSKFIMIFGESPVTEEAKKRLLRTLSFLTHLPAEHVMRVVEGSEVFFADRSLLNDFVEYLYNYWRNFKRLIISQRPVDDDLDYPPYRTFNRTIEHLTVLIRNTYRDIQENITGNHPRIYRQVSAGAEVATITGFPRLNLPELYLSRLDSIPVIQQVLIYPPLIFNSSMNKRTGMFEEVEINPIQFINPGKNWLCYPARVGALVIFVYFPIELFELNLSMCNLFELASPKECCDPPDAILVFGTPSSELPVELRGRTVFHNDKENNLLVGLVPGDEKFYYFGYLKKMILTLHNIKMIERGRMPFHGAFFQLKIRGKAPKTVLIIGDTGAGKSETLEALRMIAEKEIEDLVIIADDMGSIEIDPDGKTIGYGTETGAFIRLDDLQPGFAFGQMDRAVLINANQTNARVLIPVTTYENVIKGFRVDYFLYANNYDEVSDPSKTIEQFKTPQDAIRVFKQGRSMSKGTTTSTGITETYFANIFGPPQFHDQHEEIAERIFSCLYEKEVFVGQLFTQLGVTGKETTGPSQAARSLLNLIKYS
jgi:energy-coupling factor transporter ATP-binding protein EcfA2